MSLNGLIIVDKLFVQLTKWWFLTWKEPQWSHEKIKVYLQTSLEDSILHMWLNNSS